MGAAAATRQLQRIAAKVKVICVNNFNYGMTGGQLAPTTPEYYATSTAPFGSTELPFNLPYLAQSCGAVYVARWTVYHVKQLQRAIKEAMLKPGFTFVEVLSPCPTLYVRRNKLGDSLAVMQDYKERSVVKNGIDAREADLDQEKPIVCGKFVDIDRQSYLKTSVEQLTRKLGDRYRMPQTWRDVLS